jgi:hypothetical protein
MYLELKPYCETQTQIEVIESCIKEGSQSKAALALKRNRRNIERTIQRVKLNAAKRGYAPESDLTHPVAQGQFLKGASTLYDDEGNIKQQWVKSQADLQLAEDLLNVLEDFHYKPAPKISAPKKVNQDLCTLYTITDFHLGMYAWSEETGDDWDTEIAAKVLMQAIEEMAEGSPDSELAILNLQGDFLHWDGLEAVTPTQGHVLDADTRFGKMVELSLDLTLWAIERLLTKHKKVRVIICEGNHDLAGSVWMRKCIKMVMSKNDRVEVDDTEFPYYAYLHGEIMIGFHHGHKKKNAALPALFSSEPRYRSMWGQAKYCYIHTGHFHQSEKEGSEGGGAIVERHPTLAAADAYAVRGGYVSQRGAHAITYHKERGEVSRKTVYPA